MKTPSLFDGHDALERLLRSSLEVPFSFNPRPVPLVADLRVVWRVPVVLMTLDLNCRGGRSSLLRLHLINWALRTAKSRHVLMRAVDGSVRPQDVILRLEPTVNRAIWYAAAEGLIELQNGNRAVLVARGREITQEIISLRDCLEVEKEFLGTLGKRVTEDFVSRITTVRPG